MALKREEGPGVAIPMVRNGGEINRRGRPTRVEGTPLPPWFAPELDRIEGEYDGFWYELRGDGDALLYRAAGEDPTGASIEFPAGDSPGRAGNEEPVTAFELLVPLAAALRANLLLVHSRQAATHGGLEGTEPVVTRSFPVSIKEADLEVPEGGAEPKEAQQ